MNRRLHIRTVTSPSAFTLIELLAVILIIGVLAAILIPTLAAVREHVYATRESTAIRQAMIAYHMFADDHRGRLLAYLENGHKDEVTSETGDFNAIAPAKPRWPHRLRPYLGNRFKATLYVNKQGDYYERHKDSDYSLSLFPSFGMNGAFVGDGGEGTFAKAPPVRTLAQAALPAKLITFVSAAARTTLDPDAGYWRVVDPKGGWPAANLTDPGWGSKAFSRDSSYGWVAFRLRSKAAVAFLDGHVERKTCAQLRDMRLWCEAAALADDPDFSPR